MADAHEPGTSAESDPGRTIVPDPAHADVTLFAGRFRIERTLGQGAFGRVYRAFDTRLGSPVAIKELLGSRHDSDYAEYGQQLERFTREARAARLSQDPNIVTVYDLLLDESGTYYLVMEYVGGGSLRDLLAERGALPVDQALGIASDIARALAVVHKQDIVHRDLKPANIMLTERGDAKLMDFGIAQVGRESLLSQQARTGHPGTPLYMSPEQRGSADYLDGRSDLYSLGYVLYEMLAGESYIQMKRRPLREVRPEVPVAVARVVERLMADRIEKRYADASAALEALEEARGVKPGSFDLRDWLGRPALLASVAGALLVVMAGLVLLLGWGPWRSHGAASPTMPAPTATVVIAAAGSTAPPLLATTAPPAGATAPAPRANLGSPAAPPTTPAMTPPPTSATSPDTTAWAEPRGLMILRYPAPWIRDEAGLTPPFVLHLRGQDGLDLAAGIMDPQQGTVSAEIESFRQGQVGKPNFSDAQVGSATISGEPAQMLSFSYAPNGNQSAKGSAVMWIVNHEGKEFTVLATMIGTHRAEVDAIVASVNLTRMWTDSLGRATLQYPNGWTVAQTQSKGNPLELHGPDGVSLYLIVFSPPGGTPDSEILSILNLHKNDPKFLYRDGPTADVRIGEESGKTFSYTAISRADPNAAPSDTTIWIVNHNGNEFDFVAGLNGPYRTEIDAIIASVSFLR